MSDGHEIRKRERLKTDARERLSELRKQKSKNDEVQEEVCQKKRKNGEDEMEGNSNPE